MLNILEVAPARPEVDSQFDDFDQIIRLYQQRIYRLVLVQTGEPDLAEELTQECFVRAFLKQKSFRGECQLFTWLARIAVNLLRDHYRNRKLALWRRLISFDSFAGEARRAREIPDRGVSPEDRALQNERLRAVAALIQKLTQPQRETLLLSVVEGMPLEEIARATHRRVGTVKTHLYRAMINLRKWQEGKQS